MMAEDRLNQLRFCTNLKTLSQFFGISEGRLRSAIYGPDLVRYKKSSITKKNGNPREILAPNGQLKKLQKDLLSIFEEVAYYSHACHGFRKNHSIKTNAKKHHGAKWVLKIDLENFFPSIHYGRVFGLLTRVPISLNPYCAKHIANILCFNGKLPQGAPTSPIVANMIAYGLDKELSLICKNQDITYTRYADDLTFSSKKPHISHFLWKSDELADDLKNLISHKNFSINPLKTKLKTGTNRKTVTGIIINKKLNVHRLYIDRIRGALKAWETHGYVKANDTYLKIRPKLSRKAIPAKALANNLKGRISHVGFVKGTHDPIYLRLLTRLFLLDPKMLSEKEIALIIPKLKPHQIAKKNIFVLHNEDDADKLNLEDLTQGTTFYLDNVGFVTCSHCLKNYVKLVCPDTQTRHTIANIRHNLTHDIAIFDCPTISVQKLITPTLTVNLGDEVNVVGYPNYRDGQSPNTQSSKVATEVTISALRYNMLEKGISPGQSGGPILNSKNQLIGFAQRGGASGSTDDYRVFLSKNIAEIMGSLTPVTYK